MNCSRRRTFLATLTLAALLPCAAAQEAGDRETRLRQRRETFEPGLIVETGARTGACDVLTFTADGKHLLATGDDKVVRSWECNDGQVDPASVNVLRWAIFREKRGNIYALSATPDGKSVAIGGFGLRGANLAVLDRETGDVRHALSKYKPALDAAVWALAFSPDGNQVAVGAGDGSVWLWDTRIPDVWRLGTHPSKNASNRVSLVGFQGAGSVLSVAASGEVCRWDIRKTDAAPQVVLRFDRVGAVRYAVFDPKQRRIAVAGEGAGDTNRTVEVRSLEGGAARSFTVPMTDGHYHRVRCLAFDPTGQRLAVGTQALPSRATFLKYIAGDVHLYDLRDESPRPQPGPRPSWFAEALAFHPDGKHLAMAGGDDHEVTFWSLAQLKKPVSEIRSPGSCFWGVALSANGRHLAYQDRRREGDPPSPNQLGREPWKVFDLHERRWGTPRDFTPPAPVESLGGWRLRFGTENAWTWYAVSPSGQEQALPWDRDRDALPRCYTMLRLPGNKVGVAVGHLWGVSVYELTEGATPRRVRLFSAHAGEVMAVAVTPDGRTLVSAARDQTIAGWNLAEWPSRSPLGAAFATRFDRLFVESVDAGSPAWEAGFEKGDEVTFLAYAGKPVEGGPKAWLTRLRDVEPGRECFFRFKFGGQGAPFDTLTTVKQRPLWQFFPTRSGEWVLWRWRDYYYDTSTNGDGYIGWQVSKDVDRRPVFFDARQFQKLYHKPEKVATVLRGEATRPDPVSVADVLPPLLDLRVDSPEVRGDQVSATLTVTAQGPRELHQPARVTLWVEDHLHYDSAGADPAQPRELSDAWKQLGWQREGAKYHLAVKIPASKLRSGENRLTLKSTNRAGGSSPPRTLVVLKPGKAAAPELHALLIGVKDYSKSVLPARFKGRFADLDGVELDLDGLENALKQQQGRAFSKVSPVVLRDEKVTPASILAAVRDLKAKARPDDLMVLYFDGHGFSDGLLDKESAKRNTFVFVCPKFDYRRPLENGLSSESLYRELVQVPCGKLILLSACHAGDASANVLRDLTQDGVGPIVLAACKHDEEAVMTDEDGSLFTQAIVQALDEKLAEADEDRDGRLDTRELARFVQRRVPARLDTLLAQIGQAGGKQPQTAGGGRVKEKEFKQNPDFFPPLDRMDRFILSERKKKP